MARLRRELPIHSPLAWFAGGVALGFLIGSFAPAVAEDRAGDFDFYVLALTWTPSYCAGADNPDPAECETGRGFSVHGFWPQYVRGFPEYCPSDKRPWQITFDAASDLMPNAGIARYQWAKHGVCSGLGAAAYFGLMRKAVEKVTIPAIFTQPGDERRLSPSAVEKAFVTANAGLSVGAIAVRCAYNNLSEVQVCLAKDLAFRRCPAIDADTCHASSIAVPPVR